jgi:hypothetical protein
MSRRWMGAVLVALGLAGRAPGQMPGPPPGDGMPMYQPTFAGDPTPMPSPQFCPPGGPEPPASPFSLPNDGSPNAFSDDCRPCEAPTCYFNIGWMALWRQATGNGVLAVRDPGVNIPGIPANVDSGLGPPAFAPQLLGFNDLSPVFLNGVRASAIYREAGHAFEIAGFYMFQNDTNASVAAPGKLDSFFDAFPTPIGFQGDNFLWLQADRMRTNLSTRLFGAEANYRRNYFSGCEWLIGVRYLDLEEQFDFVTDDDGLVLKQKGLPQNPALVAALTSNAHSRIVAPQLGFECERPLISWLTVGITGKGAWGVNFLQTDVGLHRGDGFQGPSSQQNTVIFSQIYELAVWGTIGITEQFRLKAGYQGLWVVGVPQAQQQFNFNLGDLGGARSNTSSVFFHGPMVELQFAF